MINNPKISVVMPVYKEEPHVLKRAIDSILNQTFRDYEFIIVLDYPQNYDAIKLIEGIAKSDARIKLIINDKNLGVAPTLNIGIKSASGEYIARQDADDESLPDRFEIQINFIVSNNDIDVLGTAIDYVDENSKLIFRRIYHPNPEKYIRQYNPLGHPSLMIKKEIFDKFGLYSEDEQFKYVEDYELWMRWYLKGVNFFNLKESLYRYYQNRANIKSMNTKIQLRNTITLKKNYLKNLDFYFGDYLRLFGEIILLILPSRLISYLFYLITRN